MFQGNFTYITNEGTSVVDYWMMNCTWIILSLQIFLFDFSKNFWPCHVACKILVSWPRIKPLQQKLSLNHWTAREGPRYFFYKWPEREFSSVQFSHSVLSDSLWPHEPQHARPPCPLPTPGVHPNPCPLCRWCLQSSHPLLSLLLLPSIFPSIRVFSNESALRIRWPKYWSFSFNISPTNEHPGLIPFRMDWLDLFAVQGTLKSLLQHHRPNASIFWCSAFFIVHSHIHTWPLEKP